MALTIPRGPLKPAPANKFLYPGSATGAVRPLALLQLAGSQAKMGAQHGEILRQVGGWQPAMDYYPRTIEGLLRGSGTDPLTRALPTASRPLLEAALSRMERVRPESYLARSRAFTAALGRRPGHARYFQVMDVFQNVVGTLGRLGLGPFAEQAARRVVPACSTLSIWGAASASGRLLHARNFDFPGAGVWDRAPAVVFCTPDEGLRYGFVTCRGADVPGITAFNESGLCLTVHTRFHRQVRFDGAAIIDLGHDIVRRAATLDEAIAIARERRVASTWGLLVSSASEGEAVLIEINSNSVRTVAPALDEPFLAGTNHYRNPDQARGELDLAPGWRMHTEGRLQTLERTARAGLAQGGLQVDQLKALLGSHADPDLPEAERAAGGVLAQCTGVQSVVIDPESSELHMAVGPCPTGRGAWLTVPWRWEAAPGQRRVDLAAAETPAGDPSVYARGDTGEAWASYMEAGRLEALGDEPVLIRAAIERAARLDPAEPTWRLLQGGMHLRAGENAAALARFERGLESEHSPFYRGQLLLWASRAAQACGRKARATALRQELLQLRHRHLARHHRAAQREQRRPCGASQLRRTPVHVQLGDLG